MRVASAQLTPVYLDREATIAKVVATIEAAADNGAELIAFPETFVPGYPSWADYTHASHFDQPDQKKAYRRYLNAAVDIRGADLATVVETAERRGVFTYLGVAERSASGGSVYASLVAIHPEVGIVSTQRKLKPTYGERLVWSDGDGAGLVTHQWRGSTVSGLNCWENWMPLARVALYSQGAQIHVAAWPGSDAVSRDISRFIAREGRLFVVSAGAILHSEHIPVDFPLRDEMIAEADVYSSGGSIIVSPDGTVLAAGEPNREEIIYADIDIGLLMEERQNFDPTGHYGRPDVFRLSVDRGRRQSVDFE